MIAINPGRAFGRIVDVSRAAAEGRDPDAKEREMDPRHRSWALVAPIDPPEVDDDEVSYALREATLLLGVPEWVDPETGELADDEFTRLEDH